MRTPSTPLVATAVALGLLTTASAASAAPEPVPLGAAPAPSVVVKGAILARYESLGGARGFLGRALTDELSTPNGVGRYNVFEGGSIYWSPGSGAHEVHGLIREKWGALGWENSLLRFPTSNEIALRGGALNRFQGGFVYWSPGTGAHEVHGDILAKYAEFRWETGRLGYPVTDELRTPDRTGAFSLFQGGAVYWSPDTGAHQIEGAIRAKWDALGSENSGLGFPVTDEDDRPGGRVSDFELGQISWTPETGAVVTRAVDEVSRADTAQNTVTLDGVQQSYVWDANDEFASLPAGGTGEPDTLTLAEFEAQLDEELASNRARPYLVVDYSLERAGTSRFTLLKQSEPGLTAAEQARAYAALR
ncbi:MAG TPA: hypothetical protein VFR07_09995 [Mycobacteriales bacterium]|jgi:uncharacterized protein with LGFP repeats|nr:hypothetical protein [Mycobacteriales bacterium]